MSAATRQSRLRVNSLPFTIPSSTPCPTTPDPFQPQRLLACSGKGEVVFVWGALFLSLFRGSGDLFFLGESMWVIYCFKTLQQAVGAPGDGWGMAASLTKHSSRLGPRGATSFKDA